MHIFFGSDSGRCKIHLLEDNKFLYVDWAENQEIFYKGLLVGGYVDKKLVGFFDGAECGSEVYVVLKLGDFYLLEEWCQNKNNRVDFLVFLVVLFCAR